MVKTNILIICSFLYSTKKFFRNLVQTSKFKLGNRMTATQVSYFFNINYDARFQDLALNGTCISHTSVFCVAVVAGFLMVQN